MSELRVETHVDPDSWNASLRACSGTIFHTAEWGRYVQAEEPGARPEFLTLLDDDGSIAGQALVFHSKSSRRVAGPFTGSRWLDALPAVRENQAGTLPRFLNAIESRAREAGDVTFQVGSFASPTSQTILSPLRFSICPRLEFELDLTADETTLWDGLEYKRRKNIKKAARLGVELRELPADEGASHLRRLQAASFVRVVERGGPPLKQLDSRRADPIAVLTNAGVGRIVGGFVDGVCVSASFFTTFNGLAYHTLSGHDAQALETQAPTFVLWAMALRFKSEGIQRLNFGGCRTDALEQSSPEHGVYVYKKAFGGAVLECGSGEKILRPAIRRAANVLRAAMR
jgi:hypothetical protein